jgi:hypothetical protein
MVGMKSISAAIVVLAGAELIRTNGDVFVLAGIIIGGIGFVGWVSTFLHSDSPPN